MNKKEDRQKRSKLRKNFLPTLIITISLWLSILLLIYFTDPYGIGIIPLFFILASMAIFFTSSIILENTRRGLIITISLIIFMLLRYFGVGNIINLLLIVGVSIAAELYFARN